MGEGQAISSCTLRTKGLIYRPISFSFWERPFFLPLCCLLFCVKYHIWSQGMFPSAHLREMIFHNSSWSFNFTQFLKYRKTFVFKKTYRYNLWQGRLPVVYLLQVDRWQSSENVILGKVIAIGALACKAQRLVLDILHGWPTPEKNNSVLPKCIPARGG